MLALLDELGRERGWRRWRWAALAAATLTAAIVAATIAGGARDPLAACTGGRDEIDPVWNAGRGQRIRDALVQIGTPYARAIDGRILAALDGYRDRWSAMHRTACREYRSVRLSADRFDRRMQCLGRRLQDLATTVVLLEGIDAGSVTGAVDTATRLPPVEPCAEIDAFADGDEPPATAADRAQAFAIREQLSLAGALERAGRSDDALVAADRALTAAQRLSYPPVVLEAAQIKGSVLVFRGDFAEAVAPLALAEQLALEQRRLGAAVAAGARRIYADGMRGEKLDRLAGQIDVLELLSRSPLEDRSARPLLLNYVGAVYMARDDRAQARRHFEAARAAFAGPVPADSELMSIDMNLAMLTPDRATREALARAAWQRFKDQLGPQHLTTLSEQCRYAHYVVDPSVARSLLREAGELYRAFHADVLRDRSSCMSYEAFLAAELDERDTAGALYAEIAAMAKRSTDEDVASRARLAEGYVALYGGVPSAAIASFAAVIAAFASSPHWWDHQLAAEAELGAGLAEAALGRPRPAATHLERAVATLGGLVPRNEDAENRQRLALAKLHLARALRASQAPGERVTRARSRSAGQRVLSRGQSRRVSATPRGTSLTGLRTVWHVVDSARSPDRRALRRGGCEAGRRLVAGGDPTRALDAGDQLCFGRLRALAAQGPQSQVRDAECAVATPPALDRSGPIGPGPDRAGQQRAFALTEPVDRRPILGPAVRVAVLRGEHLERGLTHLRGGVTGDGRCRRS
jgi:hypothetical protein